MGDLFKRIVDYLRSEDFFDTVYTVLRENQELLLVAVAIIFIFILCLWIMLERLQKRGLVALVPVYRFVVLFRAVGMRPWLAVLMVIPGVNLLIRVIFYVFVARKFERSYLMVPGLVLLPLVFLPIVAFGDGQCQHISVPKKKRKRAVIEQSTEGLEVQREKEQRKENIEESQEKKQEEKHDSPADIGDTRPLAMAELQKKRAEEKARRLKRLSDQRVKAANARIEANRKDELAAIKPRSSRMPVMKQSPSVVHANKPKTEQHEKEQNNNGDGKSEAYRRLLRHQKLAQKRNKKNKQVDSLSIKNSSKK